MPKNDTLALFAVGGLALYMMSKGDKMPEFWGGGGAGGRACGVACGCCVACGVACGCCDRSRSSVTVTD